MKLFLALLLSLPLFAQLPAGVTRISYPGTHRGHAPLNLVATPNGVLWASPGFFDFAAPVIDELDAAGGRFTTSIALPPGGAATGGLAVASDGAIWVGGSAYSARFDPVTRRLDRWTEYASATTITAGPDGNLWITTIYGTILRVRPDGTLVSFWHAVTNSARIYGAAFGSDGAFYVSAEGQLVRVTLTGERTMFPATAAGHLYPGPGFFWVGAKFEHSFGPTRAVPADVVKLSYTGTIAGTYRVNMVSRGADAQGNLWLRRTEGANEIYAQLTPNGVLTRFAPVPATLWDDYCNERVYGGFVEMADGRVALADYYQNFAAPPGRCVWDAPGRDVSVTILDPRILPVHSVEQLNPVRRRSARH